MPLRKQGTLLKSAIALTASATLLAGAPAAASAGSWSDWFKRYSKPAPVANPAPAPAPAAEPAPAPAPVAEPSAPVSTVAAVPAAPVAAPEAAPGCTQAPTSKAFSKVGDTADYSLAPGGDFESSAGWSFTGGAKIVSGNESLGLFKGSIVPGKKSLALPVGATATSPEFCVDETNPHFRFMAKADSSMSGYEAIVIYRNAEGRITNAQFTSSRDISWGDGDWTASALSPLATKIPLTGPGATATVQLHFISTGNKVAVGIGFWGKFTSGDVGQTLIDSVMVDPYRRG